MSFELPEWCTPEVYDALCGSDVQLIRKHWTPARGDVCFDVGCGPGHWTFAAAVQGAFCYAFDVSEEAVRTTILRLLELRIGNACVVPAGFLSSTGFCNFQANTFLSDPDDRKINLMPVWSLDDFMVAANIRSVQWINMDCEAAERDVLKSATLCLRYSRPKVIIEVHAGIDADELRAMFPSFYEFEADGSHMIARPT